MIALLDRRFLAQVMIVAALILGGWIMFVQPRIAELRAIETEIAEASVTMPRSDDHAVQAMSQQAAKIRTRVAEIVAGGEAAQDSAGLYRQVMSLAEAHDVTVESLNPGAITAAGIDKSVQVANINIAAHGEYEKIASFLDALDSLRGFVRPGSMTIRPLEFESHQIAQVQVVFEAMRFELPETLASARGGADADR